jgi:hypothetical protein
LIDSGIRRGRYYFVCWWLYSDGYFRCETVEHGTVKTS